MIEGVDKVIVAAGMKSYIPFDLDSKIPLHHVGDAQKVGKAEYAIHNAYRLALTL